MLDFAGASQANIGFITDLGHRLYSEDVLRVLDDTFGRDGDFYERQAEPERAEHFLRQSVDFEPDSFDGALVWDTLQLLSPGLLQMVVDRLYEVMRPESYLLAFFNADEKAAALPVYSYRISDAKTLLLTPRGEKRPAQFFNNRSIEKLFRNFSSIKFFLTRDNLREVIVRR